jgi:hypothetical protein
MISYVWTVSGMLGRIVVSDAHDREVRVSSRHFRFRSSLIGEVAFRPDADIR